MKEKNILQLKALSPTIDYEDFYSNYHKRKKNFLLFKDFPKIGKNSVKNLKTMIKTKSSNAFDLPHLSIGKTNSPYFPKLKKTLSCLKNMNLQLRNKIPKKEGSLSIKYIDIINMNKDIFQTSQIAREIKKYINNPIAKKKILHKLNLIEINTKEEINKIANTITKKEKEDILKYFKTNHKIIKLSAEEIFKEINAKKIINEISKSNDKIKEKNIEKNKDKKNRENDSNFKDKHFHEFLLCAKNNIRRKIELRNEYNQEISVEYIEMLLQQEIEKIKIMISKYMNEKQNDDILFNPDEPLYKSEELKEKIKNENYIETLDKSIKKLIQLNNYYNSFIKNNNEEENYTNNKIMINENTQYNYNEFFQEKNNRYNPDNKCINKFNDYPLNKNMFSLFKKFSRNKKGNLKETSQQGKNGTEKDNIERRTIHTNRKYTEGENVFLLEKDNSNLNKSNSYKDAIEKGKIFSMNNNDIISLFDKTKFESNENIDENDTSRNKYKDNKDGDDIQYNDINNENDNLEEKEKDKTKEGFIRSKYRDKNNMNNNQENNNDNISSNSEKEQNYITSRYNMSNQQSPYDKEKKSNTKKNKNKRIKLSLDNITPTGEILESKFDQSKSKNNEFERNKKKFLTKNNIFLTNKQQNNKVKIKNVNIFKRSKNTKKSTASKKGRKNFDSEKTKKFCIKDFEILEEDEKIIKRNLSHHRISRPYNGEMNLKGEINVIKLHDEDINQILNYINEEEKRRIRIKEKEEEKNQEKKRKSKSNLYSLFKVKEKKEEKKFEDLTKDELITKLKNDDMYIRQYIEDIIKAGLTIGNKEINKKMKNKSILVFQGSNLGTFNFKKNFGIKEEVNIEPFRPLSHDRRIQAKDSEYKETETEKYFFKKDNKEKIVKEENKEEEMEEKERQRLKKIEEARKKLIYDNRYLFEKKKPAIQFILRKEVEEILQGGIFLQQLTKTEEEKNIDLLNRFLPKRSKFVKRKIYRGKLFKKSNFLKEVINNEPIKENNYSSSDSEIKEESDNSFENKMQKLINRIKKLKKGEELNINEIERIVNQKNERNPKEKAKEIRMQGFLHTLNEYRDMNKNQRIKNDNFSYKVPILIKTNSDYNDFSSMNNSNL